MCVDGVTPEYLAKESKASKFFAEVSIALQCFL